MKRILKLTAKIVAALLLILTFAYFYFINNAERILKKFVSSESNGTMGLEMKKLTFNPKQLRFTVLLPHFITKDSIHQSTTYDFKAQSIIFDAASITSFLFKQKLNIDSIIIMRPQILVNKWKDLPNENFSVTEQMGKVYNRLETYLNRLSIRYCLLDSGSFSLVNKLHPQMHPVTITDYYLEINNFQNDSLANDSNRLLFTDRIKFYSSHQDIIFQDGIHGIKYGKLRINSKKKRIEIDSCYLYGKKSGDGFNEFGIYADTLLLTNTDFNLLMQTQLIKADSALCINPSIKLNTQIKTKPAIARVNPLTLSRDSILQSVKNLFGDVDIGYIGVKNAAIDIQTKSVENIIPYKIANTNFVLRNVKIINRPDQPVHIGNFDLALSDYRGVTPDSSFALSFANIHFFDKKIILSDLQITPSNAINSKTKLRYFKMDALEINGISWLDLLDQKKVTAREIVMHHPIIKITNSAKTKIDYNKEQPLFNLFKQLSTSIDVNSFSVKDADIDFVSAKKRHIRLEKVNATVGIDEMLRSKSFNDLIPTAKQLSFAKGNMAFGNTVVNLYNGSFHGADASLNLSKLQLISSNGNLIATINGLVLFGVDLKTIGKLNIGALQWQNASIAIKGRSETDNRKTAISKALDLNIGDINGANTKIEFGNARANGGLILETVRAKELLWSPPQQPVVTGLALKGSKLYFANQQQQVSIDQFSITDEQPSVLKNILLTSKGKKQDLSVTIPTLRLNPSISAILNKQIIINNITIDQPTINMEEQAAIADTNSAETFKRLPNVVVNELIVNNPVFNGGEIKTANKNTRYTQQSTWIIKGIKSDSTRLIIQEATASMVGFSADSKNFSVTMPPTGKINIGLKNILYNAAKPGLPANWAGLLGQLQLEQVSLMILKNDSTRSKLYVKSLEIENVALQQNATWKPMDIFSNNKAIEVKQGNFIFENIQSAWVVNNLEYLQSFRQLRVDSISMQPRLSRDSFMQQIQWQKEYTSFSTGAIVASGFDPAVFIRDTSIIFTRLHITQPIFSLYRDKRVPFQHGIVKPLPTSMISRIKKSISIDSIQLKDASLQYEEFNDKTKQAGLVKLSRTNALVTGLKNINIVPGDSLKIIASAWLLDSAFIRLGFSEAYQDSLDAFLLHIRTGSFNLPLLNPILEPLVSARIKSGRLDTLRLTAIGREYIALGKMRMDYRHLKVQYLNKGSDEKKTLKTKLITFLANTLLRKNNHKSTGNVYAERDREKGFINYWLKMIASGAITNTGVQSNNKMYKKYGRKLKKLKVPEIPEVDL